MKRKFSTAAEWADWVVSLMPPLSDEDMTRVRYLLGGNVARQEATREDKDDER